MSFDLYLWKTKRWSTLSPVRISLCLAESIPCDALARLPRRALGAIEAAAGDAAVDITDHHVCVSLPGGERGDQMLAALQEIAAREVLVLFDPQAAEVTPEDERFVSDLAERARAEMTGGIEALRLAAEAGDGQAMNELGNAYSDGEGCPRDVAQAFSWYERSANAGYVAALVNMADCYKLGNGVAMNGEERLRCLERAGDAGWIAALVDAADCLRGGDGVPKDPVRARQLYQRALERDPCVSAFALGEMYAAGEGGERSVAHAEAMFRMARANHHPEAYLALKRLGVLKDDD